MFKNNKNLEHFLRDAERAITALDSFMKHNSFGTEALKSYVLSTHSAKSLLRSIGETEPARIASILERAGRDSDIETIKKETPSFLLRFKKIFDARKKEAAAMGTDEDDASPEDLSFLKTQLAAIKTACEAYNKRNAENAIAALEQRPCSKQTKRFIREVGLYLLRGDFEDAAALAEKTGRAL